MAPHASSALYIISKMAFSNYKVIRMACYFMNFIYFILLFIADQLTFLFPSKGDRGVKSKVLFVKLDAIGDFILWLDAAKEIRKIYPENEFEITLLGNKAWSSIAEEMNCFDAVWPVERQRFTRNPVYRLKILRKIRGRGFSTVVQPTFSRESMYGDTIVRLCGAKDKIGSQGDCSITSIWIKHICDHWYTRLIPASDEPLMELRRNAEFIRGLGLETFFANAPNLPFHFATPEGFNAKKYYVLFPGAGKRIKQWPPSNFREIVKKMYKETGWVGVICGGKEEKSISDKIEQTSDVILQNWCGKTSLKELTAIIAGAQILIGNDTGAVHIAAAVSTPSLCILGGGHYGRFMPYQLEADTDRPLPVSVSHKMSCFGCNWHCIYDVQTGNAAPCVAAISVDQVWVSLKPILIKRGLI